VKSRLYRGLAAIKPKLATCGGTNCAFGAAPAVRLATVDAMPGVA
jgi:hypothetical protein